MFVTFSKTSLRRFEGLLRCIVCAFVVIPMAHAATLQPRATDQGNAISWPGVDGLDAINVHRDDGSYITTLAADSTSWQAPASGSYFLVAVIGADWNDWERSATVSVPRDSNTLPQPRADNGLMRWDTLPPNWQNASGYRVVGINILDGDGQYLTSLPSTQTQWQAAQSGRYALQYVLGNARGKAAWSEWILTDSVFIDVDGDETGPLLEAYTSYLDSLLPATRAAYFDPFIDVLVEAMQLWDGPLLSAQFGVGAGSTAMIALWEEDAVSTRSCSSGQVTRTLEYAGRPIEDRLIDFVAPLASVVYDFSACVLNDRTLEGQASVFVQGDSPNRLGGQRSEERIIFNALHLAADGNDYQLTGKYQRWAGWTGPNLFASEEFTTTNYAGPEFWSPVNDALYLVNYRYNPAGYAGQTETQNETTEIAEFEFANGAGKVQLSNVVEPVARPPLMWTMTGGTVRLDSHQSGPNDDQPLGSLLVQPIPFDAEVSVLQIVEDMTSGRQLEVQGNWLHPIECEDLVSGVFGTPMPGRCRPDQ